MREIYDPGRGRTNTMVSFFYKHVIPPGLEPILWVPFFYKHVIPPGLEPIPNVLSLTLDELHVYRKPDIGDISKTSKGRTNTMGLYFL